jgi:hypothetical protein
MCAMLLPKYKNTDMNIKKEIQHLQMRHHSETDL